mgnify:CR=1 FL=1
MRALASTRGHPAYWAFLLHRVSGFALALFLPAHFYVLAMAVDRARLDGFLRWTELPLVKLAETALVFLLAAHMTGGLRLLAGEFLTWRDRQQDRIAVATGIALFAALLFLLSAW